MNTNLSKVEASFFNTSDIELQKTKIPYIKVSNYPDLGLITSLRFLAGAIAGLLGSEAIEDALSPSDVAPQQTTISRIYHLDRGYEKIENKLKKIGVKIKRLS